MAMWCWLLFGILCCFHGVHSLLTCDSGFQPTILGTCADTNECQGSAPCSKGTCMNTNGNNYCDDSQTTKKNNQTVCGAVNMTCIHFANCVNDTCVCQPGYTGPTCSIQLSCDKECRNNGFCDFRGTQEVCICKEGFTGSECQYSLNICTQSTSVCLNGGKCGFGQLDKYESPTCTCTGSFQGLFCEAANCSTLCYPSNNDPTCGGSCSCTSDKFGDSCQYSTCACQNGGVSVPDDTTSCRCVCPEGTSGTTCESSTANECSSSPCQNGGTCVDEIGYYTCQCPPEYSGYNCDKRCEFDRNCLWKDCMQCKNKFGDGVCDSECNNERCLFDGFDCYTNDTTVCDGTYANGTAILDLADTCVSFYDDNMCVSNGTDAQKLCQNQACGSDALDCVDNKRSSSNILGVLVVDLVVKNAGFPNETVLNESTPILFRQHLPFALTTARGFPAFFVRRLTTDSVSAGTGAQMANPYPNIFTSLKYRVFYNVANKPNCGSPSSLPCWTDMTSVSRYVALSATSLLSKYINNITQLFTCSEGQYGDRCAMNCNSKCQTNSVGRTCEMDTGKCISGCINYLYTGDNCNIVCGSKCLTTCSSIDGVCELTTNNTRCQAGYKTLYCNETCGTDTYGIDCNFTCSPNCEPNTCNMMTGYCTCMAGYNSSDPTCRSTCISGTYGVNCAGVCNTCGMNVPCNTVNGSCASCPAGKTGTMCDQACPDYSYGLACAENCSANCASVCDKTEGACSPCKTGYEGTYCTVKSKSNVPLLADPTSDMQSTIIAAIIIIVCLLVLAGIIAFILWRRNQGSEYELNEVEPLSEKKLNGENGRAIEMQEVIETKAAVNYEKEHNGGESAPLLEPTDRVFTGDDVQTQPTENATNDASSALNDDANDARDSSEINKGGILKMDLKYIDGVESKDNSLEDVRGTGERAEPAGDETVTEEARKSAAGRGTNSYLETDIDTAQTKGD